MNLFVLEDEIEGRLAIAKYMVKSELLKAQLMALKTKTLRLEIKYRTAKREYENHKHQNSNKEK